MGPRLVLAGDSNRGDLGIREGDPWHCPIVGFHGVAEHVQGGDAALVLGDVGECGDAGDVADRPDPRGGLAAVVYLDAAAGDGDADVLESEAGSAWAPSG